MRIGLSTMMRETIKTRAVLTLNKDYFRLRKPIERRVYELARKHCGTENKSWSPYLKTLKVKSGSRSSLREFRRSIKTMAQENKLPDYEMIFDIENDQVIFSPRSKFIKAYTKGQNVLPPLATWAIEKAKDILPRDINVYATESDWREHWVKTGSIDLDNHNAAFIGWCKKLLARKVT